MTYPFPVDIGDRVRALLESGPYETEDDVIRKAVDALEQRQRGILHLQKMVREATEDSAG